MPTWPIPPVIASQYPINQGGALGRPANGRFTGDLYWATDVQTLYLWTGTQWLELGNANRVLNFSLINGTQTILSATSPNDGIQQKVAIFTGYVRVTVAETGGVLQLAYTVNGVALSASLDSGAHGVGTFPFSTLVAVDPNTSVQFQQTTALTAGTAQATGVIQFF